jgi:hypothetical protein
MLGELVVGWTHALRDEAALAPSARREAFDAGALLDPLQPLLLRRAQSRRIDFALRSTATDARLEGDASQLRRVLFNVLEQALKTTRGKTLHATLGLVPGGLELALLEGAVDFPASDGGIAAQGFGLGASVAKRWVEALGGAVELSVDAQGACQARVRLPVRWGEGGPTPLPAPPLSPLGEVFAGKTFALWLSDAAQEALVARFLRLWGAEPTTVGPSNELASLEPRVNALVLDADHEEVAARWLQLLSSRWSKPLVLLTAHPSSASVRGNRVASVAKPLSAEALYRALDAALAFEAAAP